MTVISLKQIVNNILLKRRYPHHYYLEFLVYAKDALTTLAMDEPILPIRYKICTLNDNHALDIPTDYLDYVKVSVRIGQYLRPLVEDSQLDTIPNFDSNFDIQPYTNGVATDINQQITYYNGYLTPLWFMVNWNAFGENTGRLFGGVGTQVDTFKVNKQRNEIKINESLSFTEYVIEYISNGMDADSATHIDWYAKDVMEAYCMWQFKENNRTYSPGEAERSRLEYVNQRQIYRARVSDLTVDKLKRIVHKNSIAIKY